MGHRPRPGREKHRRTLYPMRWLRPNAVDKQRQAQGRFIQALDQNLSPAFPGGHQREQHNPRQHRESPALKNFRHVSGEEQRIDQQKTQQHRDRQQLGKLPQQEHHRRHQQGGNQHGARHRHAIGRGQRAGRLEAQNQQHHADHQGPVHRADINLPLLMVRGVLHEHARDVTQLDGLMGQRKRPGNHRLRGDHRGQGGQQYHRQQRPGRGQQIERIACRLGTAEDQRTLTEVVEQQRRQHQQKPGPGNRLPTKMAHVGIQRFRPSQGQHHGAENDHANARVRDKEIHTPVRVQRLEHFRLLNDAVYPQGTQHAEPEHHDRPEQHANPRRTVLLNHEQCHQHHQRQRHHPGLQPLEGQLQPLNSGQH